MTEPADQNIEQIISDVAALKEELRAARSEGRPPGTDGPGLITLVHALAQYVSKQVAQAVELRKDLAALTVRVEGRES